MKRTLTPIAAVLTLNSQRLWTFLGRGLLDIFDYCPKGTRGTLMTRELPRSRRVAVIVVAAMLVSPGVGTKAEAIDAETEAHLNWARGDYGHVECPQRVMAVAGRYVSGGNAWVIAGAVVASLSAKRGDLIHIAEALAIAGQTGDALEIAYATQCHNPGAEGTLRAHPGDVIEWLRW